MVGSGNCVYETPCGWCSKWDKKCDKKIGIESPTKLATITTDIDVVTANIVKRPQPSCLTCAHGKALSSVNCCSGCKDLSNYIWDGRTTS